MEPQTVAEIAKGLAAAIENPKETSDRLSSLGSALAAVAAKMEPQAAAEIARRGAQRLPAAMENPKETVSDRLSSLGSALEALAVEMEPQAAAELAKGLAAAMENPKETNSDRLLSLGKTLAALCVLLPSAHQSHLLALSNMLLMPVSEEVNEVEEQPYDRKLLAAVCAQLSQQDLTEVLKYPFCTGEAKQIVLLQLQAKTGRDVGGNVWKFVEQADALGIKDVGSPAERPSAKDALHELEPPPAAIGTPSLTTRPEPAAAAKPVPTTPNTSESDAQACYDRGRAYNGKRDYDKAIAEFNEAIRLDPQLAIAYDGLGRAYNSKRDYDKAIAEFNEAIRLDPNCAEACNGRGNIYYYQNDYDKAMAEFNEAIRLNPNCAEAYNSRGNIYYYKKDYDKAINEYTEAIRLDPTLAYAYEGRGNAYRKLGKKGKASADFANAKRLGLRN
jgi:tetratricopeptide (TPR) repeat protein